jgi:hypothetical protein
MVKVAALGALVLAAGLAILLTRVGDDEPVELPRVTTLQASAELAARGHRFGDSVRARVEVLVPRRSIDPGGVRLEPFFAPFELVGGIRVERRDDDETALLRYTAALRCLARACLPIADTPLRLADGAIRFRRSDGGAGVVRFAWPPVPSRSRLGRLDENLLAWRDGTRPLPARDYRVPPRVLAVLSAALALACGLAAAGLLAGPVARLVPERRPVDRRTLLERALAAVRRAAASGDTAERRRALDLLARELRAEARREARVARRLAWSRRTPGGPEMEQLVDTVERSHG